MSLKSLPDQVEHDGEGKCWEYQNPEMNKEKEKGIKQIVSRGEDELRKTRAHSGRESIHRQPSKAVQE